jgi:hypothetical protein
MAIRDIATTNMLDVIRVQREAYERGFYELVLFLEEHRGAYVRFILHGDSKDEN